MRLRIIGLVLTASVLMFLGCKLQGPKYTDELDIVLTNYDAAYNFGGSTKTYSRPDEIVKVTGDPLAPPEYIKPIYRDPMLAAIDQNMTALGWTKVDVLAIPPPAVHLLPAAWSTTTIVTGGYYGGYYCWYYPYYCGGDWYYPYYSYASSYTTGTMVMTMVNPNVENVDESRRVLWTAALNGLLSGYSDISRVTKGIDQAFAQSPYLKTN